MTVLDQKKCAEEELAELKAAALRTEKKCRKLQARRKEVIAARGGVTPLSSAPSTTAASTDTVAAPSAGHPTTSLSAAEVLSSSASPARHSHSHTQRTQSQTSSGAGSVGSVAAGPQSEGSLLGGDEERDGLVGEGSPLSSPTNKKRA